MFFIFITYQNPANPDLVALDKSAVLYAPDVQVSGKRSAHQVVTFPTIVTQHTNTAICVKYGYRQ